MADTVKLIKIRAKQTIIVNGKMLQPGEVAECDETLAAQFCKPVKGHYAFSGSRHQSEDMPTHNIVRAEKVA